jgi:hypothetical protein
MTSTRNNKLQDGSSSFSALDLLSTEETSQKVGNNNNNDDSDYDCFKAGIGNQSFTSFEEQLKVAQKREQLRKKKEMEERLGGTIVPLKDRMKMFEKKA